MVADEAGEGVDRDPERRGAAVRFGYHAASGVVGLVQQQPVHAREQQHGLALGDGRSEEQAVRWSSAATPDANSAYRGAERSTLRAKSVKRCRQTASSSSAILRT